MGRLGYFEQRATEILSWCPNYVSQCSAYTVDMEDFLKDLLKRVCHRTCEKQTHSFHAECSSQNEQKNLNNAVFKLMYR